MNETEENWDMMAEAYEHFTSGDDSYSYRIEWPCIQKMLPILEGKSIIDLGCGTGRFTFWLEKERPANVVGVDLAENMLLLAEKKSNELGSNAVFFKADISKHFTEHKYDFVFSSTVTHYIADLNCFFGNVSSMMKKGSICIFSVINPVYSAQYPIKKNEGFPDDSEWTVRYLDKRERGYIQPWIEYNDSINDFLSYSYHHTFADYINAIVNSGLSILETQEPLPPVEWRESSPHRYESYMKTPSYLIIKAIKR
jgi:2-polyprenyl-3-methyl-5-hydroxy-6-metoxy-1,4-benzoquinol methylase